MELARSVSVEEPEMRLLLRLTKGSEEHRLIMQRMILIDCEINFAGSHQTPLLGKKSFLDCETVAVTG